MKQSDEKQILLDKLFNIKARLKLASNNEKTKKELLKQIVIVRNKLADLKCEEMIEERKIKNG